MTATILENHSPHLGGWNGISVPTSETVLPTPKINFYQYAIEGTGPVHMVGTHAELTGNKVMYKSDGSRLKNIISDLNAALPLVIEKLSHSEQRQEIWL